MVKEKILVTGARSMIGRAVCKALVAAKHTVYPIYHEDVDLLDLKQTYDAFSEFNPDKVIHCAGYNGNISFNAKYPADIYYQTTQMALNVLRVASEFQVNKIVSLISSCSYPDSELLIEEDMWNGQPHPSVDAHAFAKRAILEYGRQIYKQHNIPCIGVVVNTVYGPWDSFNVHKTKVIGGLISKFVEAKSCNLNEVECWGTGSSRREFIYVDDVAQCVLMAMNRYDDSVLPLNMGSGKDYSIKELSELIAEVVGYKGKISWDTSKPDGQMRKLLDNDKMMSIFGPIEFTPLKEGLIKTVQWYENIVCPSN